MAIGSVVLVVFLSSHPRKKFNNLNCKISVLRFLFFLSVTLLMIIIVVIIIAVDLLVSITKVTISAVESSFGQSTHNL